MGNFILLIDDDLFVQRSLSRCLERAGCSVMCARTGDVGLELARLHRPDLILLDTGLPGIDGLDALHHLRRADIAPVILLTARHCEREEALGLTLGADDYIKKLCDPEVLETV